MEGPRGPYWTPAYETGIAGQTRVQLLVASCPASTLEGPPRLCSENPPGIPMVGQGVRKGILLTWSLSIAFQISASSRKSTGNVPFSKHL